MNKEESHEKNETQQNKKTFHQRWSNLIAWFKEKKIRWIGGLILLVIAIFFIANNLFQPESATGIYQTAVVERGSLVAVVGATGIVEPRQTANLNWQTTGRVEKVYVNLNDQVEEGEILADLADNTLPQSVILAQADLVDARKALEDLINSDTQRAEAYRALLEAQSDLKDAEDDRNQWNYNNASWERIYTARTELIEREEELKDAQAAFDQLSDLPDDDEQKIEAKTALDEARLERDKALRALNYILGKAYSQQVAEDFADYEVALAKLQDAQREWERVKDGPNPDDIKAAEARVAAAEATLSLGELEAPFAGTVTGAVPKVGDYVSANTSGFRIDDLSELLVKVDISEVDINRVELGQKVELSFDAIIGETYHGEVVEVSDVGKDTGGGVDFEVTLEILDADNLVRPGMTAAVNIVVSEIKDALIVPNRAIRLRNGQRVVYLLKDNRLEAVEVVVGASSDTHSEIVKGNVAEGDLVVLNPPPALLQLQTNGAMPPFVSQ